MGPYELGNPVALVENFKVVDPITDVETLTNPTTVVFTVTDPEAADHVYTFGTSPEVTNPSVGVFVCVLSPPPGVGVYEYVVVGTGTVVARSRGQFTVVDGLPVGNEYLGVEDIKGTTGILGTFTDDDVRRALDAACRGIDRACGRPQGFYPGPTNDTIKYYRPVAPDKIIIDDLIELVELNTALFGTQGDFDHVWSENDDFTLEPYNALSVGQPFTRIVMNPWAATQGFPYWAPRSARVTGRFGWPETPAGIVEASGLLTNRLLQRAKSAPLGVIFNADMASRIAFSDPDVKELIKPFIREEVW